jgi:hypothetical protein
VAEGPQAVRSFVAVGAGFFAIQMLGWGVDAAVGQPVDAKALLTRLAYTAALEALGGYITARLAIRRPTLHAVVLGALMVAATLPITIATWATTPAWYAIWALLLILPMTIFGAFIHERLARRSAHGH